MNNLCVLPFNSLSIDATGDLRPCCSSGSDVSFKSNVKNLTADEIINNLEIVSLRQEFLEDKKPNSCKRCWAMESIGTESFRGIANNKPYGLKDNKVIQIKPVIDFSSIQFLDITLGNKCNLACRMCHPNSSSLLAKQWKILNEVSIVNDVIEFDRNTRDRLIEIISKSENLDTIYMLGGEPLVNDFHNEILEHLIRNNRAKNITLQYNTNLNVDLDKYLDMWSHFRMIDLGISIDGSHETYEYIRWPGKWNKVWNNLIKVAQYDLSNVYPMVATTVQNLNIDNLHTLISEVISYTDLSFYFIPITGVNQLHFISTEVLEKSLTDIQQLPNTLHRKNDLINMVESAIIKSKSLQLDDYNLKQFFQMQRKYDTVRDQNLFKTKPHFAALAERMRLPTWN